MVRLQAILLMLLLSASMLAAQTLPARQVTDTLNTGLVGNLLESIDIDPETAGGGELIEWLHELIEEPINLNDASADVLMDLPFLDRMTAASIVAFRETFGPFDHVKDLLAVEGVSRETVRLISPFVTTGDQHQPSAGEVAETYQPDPSEPIRLESLHRIGRRMDTGRGYQPDTTRTTYLGSPYRVYQRIRARRGRNVQLNVTLEKDPGEAFVWDPSNRTYGFDFVSGHLALRDLGLLRTFVVGDFNMEAGQGLVFWRGTGFSKGPAATRAPVKNGRGVTPFSSSDASRYFRGLAASVHPHNSFQMSFVVARTPRDATVDSLTYAPETVVTSSSLTGLHRTPSELNRKGALVETMLGGRLQYLSRSLHVGVTSMRVTYDKRLVRGNAPYRMHYFEGSRYEMVAGDIRARLAGTQIFGEAAYGGAGSTAAVVGILSQPAEGMEMLVMARHYPPAFHSPFGHGFGERSGATQNESGVYTGFFLRPSSRWRVSGYFDQFRFPWVRFGVYRPSVGYDMFAKAEWHPDRRSSAYLQIRNRLREESASTENGLHSVRSVRPAQRVQFRLHGETRPSAKLAFRGRIELSHFRVGPETYSGFLVFQDVRWWITPNLMVDVRAALFSTDGFDARIYAYEYDLLNVFSIPVFFGDGQRQYALIRYDLNRKMSLWAKVMETRWEHIRSFGSGLDETEGNRLREFRVQLRLRL